MYLIYYIIYAIIIRLSMEMTSSMHTCDEDNILHRKPTVNELCNSNPSKA